MAGVPALRERLSVELERAYALRLDPENELTITSGATEAIFDAITCVVRPGDEVIVLDPAYDSYEPAVLLQGARVVHVPLTPPDFSIDWQRVEDALSVRTRLLVVNFPHNPSGAVMSPEDLTTLAALVQRTGMFVLSDEVYEHIVFDAARAPDVLRHPELFSRSFAIGSFGKSFTRRAGRWVGGSTAGAHARGAEGATVLDVRNQTRRRSTRLPTCFPSLPDT